MRIGADSGRERTPKFISKPFLKNPMRMRSIGLAFLLVFLILLIGCSKFPSEGEESTTSFFTSPQYSFSFSYPSEWQEVTEDLPNKWAIKDESQDTILFTVNKAPFDNLALLGNLQAVRDLYEMENQSGLSEEKMDAISKIVKLKEYSSAQFYTYAIDFSDKNVQSIVSGTVCNGQEITIVLVAHTTASIEKTAVYESLLDSFECTA